MHGLNPFLYLYIGKYRDPYIISVACFAIYLTALMDRDPNGQQNIHVLHFRTEGNCIAQLKFSQSPPNY